MGFLLRVITLIFILTLLSALTVLDKSRSIPFSETGMILANGYDLYLTYPESNLSRYIATDPSKNGWIAIAPNLKWAIYSDDYDRTYEKSRYYFISFDNPQNPKLIVDSKMFAQLYWSPQGDYVFLGERFSPILYKISTNGKIEKLEFPFLKSTDQLEIFFNENWIIYQGMENDIPNIYRSNLDGKNLQKLTNEDYGATIYKWSIDKEWIYYRINGGGGTLYKMRRDGTDKQPVPELVNLYYMSPDDNHIVLGGGQVPYEVDRLYCAKPDGTENVWLNRNMPHLDFAGWSADSEWFIAIQRPPSLQQQARYWQIRCDNGKKLLIPLDIDYGIFSPDKKWIYLHTWKPAGFYRIKVGAKQPELVITDHGQIKSWSPDNEWILWDIAPYIVGGNWNYAVSRADGEYYKKLSDFFENGLKATNFEQWIPLQEQESYLLNLIP